MTDEMRTKFGSLIEPLKDQSYCWKFDFEVQHPSVFNSDEVSFGALYNDCEGVPMILCETQTENTTSMLDITVEMKNIHFEEL